MFILPVFNSTRIKPPLGCLITPSIIPTHITGVLPLGKSNSSYTWCFTSASITSKEPKSVAIVCNKLPKAEAPSSSS